MTRWIAALAFGILGLVLGLAYGWVVDPVKFVDTTPSSLRWDYRTDYVLMVAESYHMHQDLDGARRELSIFGGTSEADLCEEALRSGRNASYSQSDLALIEELDRALGVLGPTTLPTGGTP